MAYRHTKRARVIKVKSALDTALEAVHSSDERTQVRAVGALIKYLFVWTNTRSPTR